ncbi:DUF2057 domain-containing protein [uncultured Psychrobacter sp.]|uniref:DUF2057 domain-containing protein n=1 Tax=uncultured Psychrobacter sp. TaxID=259303 RepID=UPI00259329EB|nr:DUF2057 domain-containing protein [uncultured Psychrobacter sp.]
MTDRSNKPMFNKLLTLAGIGLFSLTFAHAEVTLSVDDNIKVTAINGQQVNSSPFQSLKKSFNLQPGKHVITAKYDRLYDLRNDEHDYLRSGNVTVTAEMQDNQTYRLAMPGQPEKYKEAKQYAKAPTLAVMKGSQVVSKSTGVIEEGGLFSSITSLFGSNDAQMENQKAIAAINADGKSSSSNAIAPVSTNSNSAQADTLDRFMQLWLQATPDEREKIRQWIQK